METEELVQRIVLAYQTPSGDTRVSVEAVSMQPLVTLECKHKHVGECKVQLPRRALLRLANSAGRCITEAAGREGVSGEVAVTSTHGPIGVFYCTVERATGPTGPIDAEFERDHVVEAFLVMPPGAPSGPDVRYPFVGRPFARFLQLVEEALETLPIDYDSDDDRDYRRRRR